MKRIFLGITLLLFISNFVFAQYSVNGKIIDYTDGRPLDFVHVLVKGQASGSISDEYGHFVLNTPIKSGQLTFQSVGFKTLEKDFSIENDSVNLGVVYLKRETVGLDEITITAGLVTNEKYPVTVSSVSARTIQRELGDRPLTFSLTGTPGVYSVRNGGGSGDAEISIRGFSQENVGVLLNGIPINGVENGLIYWSNWLGLSNAAAEIQIQKGPGFSNAGTHAVGGSINIITDPAGKQKFGSIIYQLTSYGNQKVSVSLNSGQLNNGWSISMLGSYMAGPGYVDATFVKGGSYYLALSKAINSKNRISITALGAPQRHGQRTLKLSSTENSLMGNRFNKDWGSMDGRLNNASENFYHRPFLGINHYLQIDDEKKLTNSVYLIVGSGGGKWSESFNYAPSIFEYRTHSKQIDWPAIYENNATHENSYTLENGQTVNSYSLNIQTHFLASHVQSGLLSNYEQKLTPHLKLVAGFHYRYFNSFLREEIVDLLGGKFFVEDYGWAVDGVSGREQIKTVGDIIRVNNNSIIHYANTFAQLLLEKNNWTAFLSANGNSNWYQRIDRFNYTSNTKSEVIVKPGFDLRAGLAYQPGIRHTIYANGAYISKAPYFKYVFGNFTNVPVQNLINEKIATVELGYKFENESLSANVNAFYTDWQNVSMLSDEYVQLENNRQTRAMIHGLKSVHMGFEATTSARLSANLSIGGMIALGNFRWKNDVTAQLFNNDNVVVDTVNVFVKDLFVGGTAQQQLGLFANLRLLGFIQLKGEWFYYNNIFANFAPTTRNNPDDHAQPFQLPAYNLLNVYVSIPFTLFKQTAVFQFNTYNLLNTQHIEWGEDGPGHDLDTFRGFWSFGRNFEWMLKLNF